MMNDYTIDKKLLDIFVTYPIPPVWYELIDIGETVWFDKALVNYHYNDGIIFINSMSRLDKKFSKSMIALIIKLVIYNDKVVLASSVNNIESHLLKKYGFRYNTEYKVYLKGV